MAYHLTQAGKPLQAIGYYDNILKTNPNDFDATYGMAYAMSKAGDPQTALEYYQKALKLQPNNPQIHHNIAAIQQQLGNQPESKKELDESILDTQPQSIGHEAPGYNDPKSPNYHTIQYEPGTQEYENAQRASGLSAFADQMEHPEGVMNLLSPFGAMMSSAEGGVKGALDKYKDAYKAIKDSPNPFALPQPGDNDFAPPTLRAATDVLAGTAKGAFGIAGAVNPEVAAFNIGQNASEDLLPKQLSRYLTAPVASTLEDMELTPDSDTGKNLVELADIAGQLMVMKGAEHGIKSIKEIGEKILSKKELTPEEAQQTQETLANTSPEELQKMATRDYSHTPAHPEDSKVSPEHQQLIDKKAHIQADLDKGNLSPEAQKGLQDELSNLDNQILDEQKKQQVSSIQDNIKKVFEQQKAELEGQITPELSEASKEALQKRIGDLDEKLKSFDNPHTALESMAQEPELENKLKPLVDAGVLTDEGAKQITDAVNQYSEVKKSIPEDLDESKKSEILPHLIEKRRIEQEAKGKDSNFKPHYDEKIKAIDQKVQDILNPKQEQEKATSEKSPIEPEGSGLSTENQQVTESTKEPENNSGVGAETPEKTTVGEGAKKEESTPTPPEKNETDHSSPTEESEAKKRKFTQQILNDDKISDEVKEGLSEDAINYVPRSNELTNHEVNTIIEAKGLEGAKADVLNDSNGMHSAVRVTMAENLIRRFNEEAKKADREGDSALKTQRLNDTIDIIEHITKKLTEHGQAVQSASLFKRLSPEGRLLALQRDLENVKNKKLEKLENTIENKRKGLKKVNKEAVDEVLNDKEVKDKIDGTQTIQEDAKAKKDEPAYGSKNKVVTKKAYNEIKKRLKGTLNSGVNPEQVLIAVYHLEAGAREFYKFSAKMIRDLGASIRNQLPELYDKGREELVSKGYDPKDFHTSDEVKHEFEDKHGKFIARDINQELKSQGENIRDIVKQHYTKAEEVRKSLAEKLVEKAGVSEEYAKSLSETIQRKFDQLTREKKLEILRNGIKTRVERLAPIRTKSLHEKLIELSNLGAFTDRHFRDVYAEKMGLPKLSDENVNDIIKLGEAIEQAPEGSQKAKAIRELYIYTSKIKGINKLELAKGLWYSSILSGHRTHARNLVENAFSTLSRYFGSANPVKLKWEQGDWLPKAQWENPKNAWKLGKALVKGWNKGLLEAADIMRHGQSHSKIDTGYLPVLDYYRFKGGKLNPANYAKYVGRALNAADSIFYEGLKEMRAHELAKREMTEKGKSWNQAWGDATELLYDTKERRIEAEQKAKDEGLRGLDYRRRVYEIMEQSRPERLVEDAHEFAEKGTYNFKPEGVLGLMSNAMSNFSEKFPPVKFIVPFTRISANVVNQALNYTPIGLWRAITGRTGAFMGKEFGSAYHEYTPEERGRILSQSVQGILASGALYAATEPDKDGNSWLQITANGTGDIQKNYELQSTGWQPYSIKIGDKWYNYAKTPWIFIFAPIGFMRDAEKYGQDWKDEGFTEKATAIAWSSTQAVMGQSFMSGLNDFLGRMFSATPTESENSLKQFIVNVPKSFVPQGVTQAYSSYKNLMDMPLKDAKDNWDKFLKGIPFAENGLRDKLNALGQPIIQNTSIFVSGEKSDPYWKFITDHQTWVSTPKPNSAKLIYYDHDNKIEKPLDNDQFYSYVKRRGELIRYGMDYIMPESKGLPDNEIQKVMKKLVSYSGKLAKAEIVVPDKTISPEDIKGIAAGLVEQARKRVEETNQEMEENIQQE